MAVTVEKECNPDLSTSQLRRYSCVVKPWMSGYSGTPERSGARCPFRDGCRRPGALADGCCQT